MARLATPTSSTGNRASRAAPRAVGPLLIHVARVAERHGARAPVTLREREVPGEPGQGAGRSEGREPEAQHADHGHEDFAPPPSHVAHRLHVRKNARTIRSQSPGRSARAIPSTGSPPSWETAPRA